MNYLIKWQFTKNNPIEFKTQEEIIKSCLIPLVEARLFLDIKFSFYITRVYYTEARLAVFVEEKNLDELKNYIKKYTESLILNPKDQDISNDWDGTPVETKFTFLPDTKDKEEIFYTKYLEDITWIGIELHKKDLKLAIRDVKELANKVNSNRSNQRELFNPYFYKFSEKYRNKTVEEIDRFWGDCGFNFNSSGTCGSHFFYNIVLGLDPFNCSDPKEVLKFI